jgi:hypothetical protein
LRELQKTSVFRSSFVAVFQILYYIIVTVFLRLRYEKKLINIFSSGLCALWCFRSKASCCRYRRVEISGAGVTASDAASITRQITNELSSWGTINVVQGQTGAEYTIKGTLSRQNSSFVLTAVTTDTASQKALNEYREEASSLSSISISSFCAKATDRIPFPNYLLGKWQSEISMPDGTVICIIEFRSDRTVDVERYDTWEHKQNNALRYEGFGKGAYSYAGYANRTITVNSQQIRIDATVNISLELEETLPEQTSVNQTGMSLVVNSDRSSFDFVIGSLPCGKNYDGPSVYSSDTIAFRHFVKIR